MDYIKIKNSSSSKGTINRVKVQGIAWHIELQRALIQDVRKRKTMNRKLGNNLNIHFA